MKQRPIWLPAFPGKSFRASIYDIGSTADPESREVVCWARVDNSDGLLRPGYFAQTQITVGSSRASVVVPLAAALPTEKGMICYVVQDGRAVARKVEPGLQVTGDAIEILSGLKPGEQLVVEGSNTLEDKVPVSVTGTGRLTSSTAEQTSAERGPRQKRQNAR